MIDFLYTHTSLTKKKNLQNPTSVVILFLI